MDTTPQQDQHESTCPKAPSERGKSHLTLSTRLLPSINLRTFSSRSQMRGQGREAFHETAMVSEQGDYISSRDESNMTRETDEWQAATEEKMGAHTRKEVLLYPVGHKFPTFSQFPLLTASSD